MNIKEVDLKSSIFLPNITLEDPREKYFFAMYIGKDQAHSINNCMKNYQSSVIMTHDLIKNILCKSGLMLYKVIITEIRDNTFRSKMVFRNIQINHKISNEIIEIDSRPSDAIAIAIRMDVPIFVEENLCHKYNKEYNNKGFLNDIQRWVNTVKPEDLDI